MTVCEIYLYACVGLCAYEYLINDCKSSRTRQLDSRPYLSPRGSWEAKTHFAIFLFLWPVDDGFHGGGGAGALGVN